MNEDLIIHLEVNKKTKKLTCDIQGDDEVGLSALLDTSLAVNEKLARVFSMVIEMQLIEHVSQFKKEIDLRIGKKQKE